MSLREDAKKIYSSSLAKLDPKDTVLDYLKTHEIILPSHKTIYPVAFGKASISMMSGCLDYLSKEVHHASIHGKPVVISNSSTEQMEYDVDLFFSSHPVPSEKSILAGDKIISYIKSSTKDELVIFLISGGASALLCKPPSSIMLNDKIILTDILLKSGASINEMNTVRKHISEIKGGRLANIANPSSCYSLIISDVINDDISSIASGPTVSDETTFNNALNILEKYDLLEKTPSSIISYIKKGINGDVKESIKNVDNCVNDIISSNKLYREQLSSFAKKNGYKPIIIPGDLTGEAKIEALSIIENINKYTHQNNDPIALISGGETVVNMTGSGKGGRNQELALSFLANYKKIETQRDWLLLSVGTDGIDGPTDAAGGIIDSASIAKMQKLKMDVSNYLENNDSYTFLEKIDSLYITGPSGTNVADIQLILIK